FVFELSKVQLNHVRLRMLGQLQNVDMELARRVAEGLGLDLPPPIAAAKEPITMPPSDALSILKRAPVVAGRSLGMLVSNGAEAKLVYELQDAASQAGVIIKIIAEK